MADLDINVPGCRMMTITNPGDQPRELMFGAQVWGAALGDPPDWGSQAVVCDMDENVYYQDMTAFDSCFAFKKPPRRIPQDLPGGITLADNPDIEEDYHPRFTPADIRRILAQSAVMARARRQQYGLPPVPVPPAPGGLPPGGGGGVRRGGRCLGHQHDRHCSHNGRRRCRRHRRRQHCRAGEASLRGVCPFHRLGRRRTG